MVIETKKFINEIGNPITIKIKRKNDIGTNAKSGKKIKIRAVNVSMIGPFSKSENIMTWDEALELNSALSSFIKKQK